MITRISIVEYVLLALAIAIHTWLFMVNELYLHPTALGVARHTENFGEFCQLVEYNGRCELAFAYTWLFSKIPPQMLVAPNVLALLTTYIVTRRLLRSGIAGAFAAFMYAITPSILTSYFLEQSGLLLVSPLVTTAALLVAYGLLVEGKKMYLAVGLALSTFMIFHPAGLLPLLTGFILLLSDYVEGALARWKVKALLAMTLVAIIALVVAKPTNYDVYTVPLTVMSIVFLSTVYVVREKLQASYKAVMLVLTTLLGAACGLLIYVTEMYRSVVYIATPSPIAMYGLPGLIAIPGFLLATRTPTSREERLIALTALPVALLTIIGYFAITTAISLLAFTGSIIISKYAKAAGGAVSTSKIRKLAITLTVIMFVVVPTFCSYTALTRFTRINVLSKEVVELSLERGLDTGLSIDLRILGEDIASAVKLSAKGEKVLIVTHWDYGYWVQSALAEKGIKALTLSHQYGSSQSKSLVSRIFINEWRTSEEILRNISREMGVEDVYVLITTTYSAGLVNNSYVGVPQAVYTATSQYPVLMYSAYGDLTNIPMYLKFANKTEGDYLFLGTGVGERSKSLMWTVLGREILIVQLCISAMSKAGYSAVYNNMVETRPLNATITGFELVYLENIPVGEVNVAYYGVYSVYYMVALFKLLG